MSELTIDAAWRQADEAMGEYWRIRSLTELRAFDNPLWEVVATDGRRIRRAEGGSPESALLWLARSFAGEPDPAPTWAHTAENDPAGLYDDSWEPRHD